MSTKNNKPALKERIFLSKEDKITPYENNLVT